jgi:hypothetical protein
MQNADLIHTAFPALGSAGGENGTVTYALNHEVQMQNSGNKVLVLAAVLSSLAAVGGVAIVVLVIIVRNRRTKQPAAPPSGSADVLVDDEME